MMFEQAVADFCWHAREVASSGMGLLGWLWGRRGPSGFGSASTAEEVTAGVDASNITAIVTGRPSIAFFFSSSFSMCSTQQQLWFLWPSFDSCF